MLRGFGLGSLLKLAELSDTPGMRAMACLILQFGAAGLAMLVFVAPAVSALSEVIAHADWALIGLDHRGWGLLVRGGRIAVCAALLAQVVGATLAVGLVAPARSWLRRLTLWVCCVVVLTPPYVAAYGWSLLILPDGLMNAQAMSREWLGWLATEGRAIACIGMWTAPIAGVVLAGGWRMTGWPAMRLALPDALPWKAFVRAGAPAMAIWVGLAMTACVVLAITEYSVCHLCLVQVWNTEILAEVQNLARSGQAMLLGWPIVVVVLVLCGAWLPARRRLARLADELAELPSAAVEMGTRPAGRGLLAATGVVATLMLLLTPWVLVLRTVPRPGAFVDTWSVFHNAWRDGVVVGLAGMFVSLWLAVGVDFMLHQAGWTRRVALLLVVLAGIFALGPPVLVGDAFSAAYASAPLLTDSLGIVSLTAAARYALIAIAAVVLSSRLAGRDTLRAAAVDGADAWTAYVLVRLPVVMRAVGGVAGVIAVLCATEVSATQMITPPGVDNLALTLLNMIHFGRNEEVAATMIYLLLAIALVAAVPVWGGGWGRRRGRRKPRVIRAGRDRPRPRHDDRT
jgi:ABC-type Fe3+ transport system permease subunit